MYWFIDYNIHIVNRAIFIIRVFSGLVVATKMHVNDIASFFTFDACN